MGRVVSSQKVLIYATCARGLLVFEEPDFPHIALQVPGGTVEPGEDLEIAAMREFEEETGLTPDAPFTAFHRQTYNFTLDGQAKSHARTCFHVRVADDLPETWDHYEMHASGGAGPILFRYSWMSLHAAKHQLGTAMGDAVTHLPIAER